MAESSDRVPTPDEVSYAAAVRHRTFALEDP
jgi:hypothetical protein